MGDSIMMLPLVYSLKKALPGSTIDVLANKDSGAAEVLSYSPNVDRVFSYRMGEYCKSDYIKFFFLQFPSIFTQFRSRHYNAVFSVIPNPLRKVLLFVFPADEKFISNNYQCNRIQASLDLLDGIDNVVPRTDYDTLLKFGADIEKVKKKLSLPIKTYILLNLEGKSRSRSLTCQQVLINKLSRRLPDMSLVVVGKHPNHSPLDKVYDLVNKTNLEEVGVLIKHAKLFITIDGGLLHIGLAQKVPLIGLFGTVNSQFRCPVGDYPYFKAFDGRRDAVGRETSREVNINHNYLDDINLDSVVDAAVNYIKPTR
jgi:ADP-heptose:LPS heptosyltransferase